MKADKRSNILYAAILWLLSILVIYPLLMVLMTSFKEKREASGLSVALPREWLW